MECVAEMSLCGLVVPSVVRANSCNGSQAGCSPPQASARPVVLTASQGRYDSLTEHAFDVRLDHHTAGTPVYFLEMNAGAHHHIRAKLPVLDCSEYIAVLMCHKIVWIEQDRLSHLSCRSSSCANAY
jgi:hypothetical protein